MQKLIEAIEANIEQAKIGTAGEAVPIVRLQYITEELEAVKVKADKDRQTLDMLYAELKRDPYIGMWEIGARLIEILMTNK